MGVVASQKVVPGITVREDEEDPGIVLVSCVVVGQEQVTDINVSPKR